MGLIPRQPTVEELGWGNSPFPIPAFSLQPFAFSLFLITKKSHSLHVVKKLVSLVPSKAAGNPLLEALSHFRLEAEPLELYSQVEPGNKKTLLLIPYSLLPTP